MTKTREAFQGVMTGRLVQGDCFEPQTKDQDGNLRVYKSGPNVGQPNPQFFIAVAYRKDDPYWPTFIASVIRMATTEWPTLFPASIPHVPMFGVMANPGVNPLFAYKVRDGDGVTRTGVNNADKEGFPGHWIVSYASAYPPKVVRPTGKGVWQTVEWTAGQPKPIKRGHYIRVAGSMSSNDSVNTPGLYMNLDMIEFVAYGEEIVGGPDAATAFATPAALPPGASAVPIGGAPAPTPDATGAAPPPPGAALPPPAVVTPPPAPSDPVMLPAAGATTYDQYRAAGWTDAQLVDKGFMAPTAPAAVVTPPPPAAGAPEPYGGHMGNVASTAGAPPPPSSVSGATMISPSDRMTALAAGTPYEVFIGKGWTDALLIQHGYMTAPAAVVTPPPPAAGAPEPYGGHMGNVASTAGAPPPPSSVSGATISPSDRMTALAAGTPYEVFIGKGWTDALLIQHGYMTA